MRHEISPAERSAIHRARAAAAERGRQEREQADRKREQAELDEHQGRMELRFKTQ